MAQVGLQFPAPSAVSPPLSPVNPKSHVAPFHSPPARVLSPLFFPAKSLLLPKPCGKREQPKVTWSPSDAAAAPGFKSQDQSSSAAPFLTPPTISYTCQHSVYFQHYWAAIVSLGRCGPMAWSQSSPSSHPGTITRGSCLPVTSWVKVTPSSLAQSMATAI